MLIKNIPINERPRERFLYYGADSLSNEELLSLLLKTGSKDKSVKEVACEVLKKYEDLGHLQGATKEELMTIIGIGQTKALIVLSAIELGRRMFLNQERSEVIVLSSADSIYHFMKYLLNGKKQEYFYCLYLNSKKELIERKLLFMGTLNRSIVHPREVFKHAYLTNASSIICVHNHPSGDLRPSKEDIHFTDAVMELGSINGIPVVDHIIIGDYGYYSFYDDQKILDL